MTLNGLDLASYQTGLNAGTIAGDFNIVKATQGRNYVNPSCDTHVQQTLKAGKKLGVYHFLENADGAAQADYFLTNVKGYIGKALLALDFESYKVGQVTYKATPAQALAFLNRIVEKTGIRPLIYMGIADENAYDWSAVVKGNFGLWVAQYNNYNVVNGFTPRNLYGKLRNWSTAAIFQYTSYGRLSGWGAVLDFNVFYGDRSAWDKYIGKVTATEPITVTPAKPVIKPAAKQTAPKSFKDALGDTWIYESAKFTLSQNINLRWGAKVNSALIATLSAGTTIKYDAYSFHNGNVWLRQPRGNGQYGYLASGTESGGKRTSSWGKFS